MVSLRVNDRIPACFPLIFRNARSAMARGLRIPILALLAVLWASSSASAQEEPAPSTAKQLLDEAVAWHFDGSAAEASRTAPLRTSGAVDLGEELSAPELQESLARGGDGRVAVFNNGELIVDAISRDLGVSGDECTILVRLRVPQDGWSSARVLSGGVNGASLAMEGNPRDLRDVGLAVSWGPTTRVDSARVLPAPSLYLASGKWHDAVVRCRGQRIELFLDGLIVAHRELAMPVLARQMWPLSFGGAEFDGALDHVAIWTRALSDAELNAVAGGSDVVAQRRLKALGAITRAVGRDDLTAADQQRGARVLRERLQQDRHRPRYHFTLPEGKWNDINGLMHWKGRYHLFVLGRAAPDVAAVVKGDDTPYPRESWFHASSRDLVHWVHHPPALRPNFDGSTPRGVFSGDAVDGASTPTLIYHVPGQGICTSTSVDDWLIEWKPAADNPVIPEGDAADEFVVFDPCCWREDDGYYALVGNRNRRPGFEGDSTSLFHSNDLKQWSYIGPFYKSDRRWTGDYEDCACPDFFRLGDKYMLLMHTHRPTSFCQYYIGRYENHQFIPERHGRLSYVGGLLGGPETLRDDGGRRIFMAWVREAEGSPVKGWTSAATLPRAFSLSANGNLCQEPIEELAALRYNHRRVENVTVASGAEMGLDGITGDCMELNVAIEPGEAREFGVNVRQSTDGSEVTPIVVSMDAQELRIELTRSSNNRAIRYPSAHPTKHALPLNIPESERYSQQETMPIELEPGQRVRLRVFLDRSVLEVFLNDRWCMTQRIYPENVDSTRVSLFSREGSISVTSVDAWDIDATNWY